MGSFSWLKADDLTNIENIAYGASFKFLIPKEFGGGFIKDKYQDYGYLGRKDDGTPKYDMYELLAFWNSDMPYGLGTVKNRLYYGDDIEEITELPMMKEIDEHTDKNRKMGISIGCYNDEIDKLKYPLKLVSPSFKGCYEDLSKPSYNDPNQGFGSTRRKKNC
ncbi:hypothetical protein [Romboutsia ilealis]|uniref:hypothetical protein n=1 Tax=Romboutsia ilealis TaxID=1115758 RepID=UPI0026F38B12|nr:hypothetical protein [Romboutsia ilealis]